MTLRDLIAGLDGCRLVGDAGVEVRAVRGDSREVERGDVFVATRGLRSDGHDFVAMAIERGAAAVVVERELGAAGVAQVVVADTTHALGVLTAHTLGEPGRAMTLIGVTGTNGKTTTTYVVEAILAAAGHRVGVIGTVELRWPGTRIAASYTTPTPAMLHGALAQMRDAGCTHVVMEVTSIALSAQRVAGLEFAVAAFSNLTQDHLDFHGTMDAYRDAKRALFASYLHARGCAVANVDDAAGGVMLEAARANGRRTLRVSARDGGCDVAVVAQDSTVRGISATLRTPRGELAVAARPLIGHYNVDNLALSIAIAEALAVPHEAIVRGIAALAGVPGRVERVVNDADLDIFVDYAHTPDALHNVLSALRPLTKRRLICVFGCGGDRDPTKRPKMGAAVAALADLAIVTSDNPRTEAPRAIIDQILPAVPRPFFVDADRRTAIRAAIAEATPGDVVVIAGKGHEDYQILGTTKHHFDDREEARAAVFDRWRRSLVALADDVGGALRGDPNAHVTRVIIDSRIAAPGDCYVAIRGEHHDGHAHCAAAIRAGARAVIVDASDRTWAPIEPTLIASEYADLRDGSALRAGVIVVATQPGATQPDATRAALAAIARGHRERWSGKLVAITGSAGKTTTKELTRVALAEAAPTHAADGSLNNETGVPLTLLGLRALHSYGVVEMGMRGRGQIEYLTRLAQPDVAVVVNAGTAHIELLGSTDAIAEAKSEIWLGLRPQGTVVRPVDDARLERHARAHQPRSRHVTFGELGADVALVEYTPRDDTSELVIEAFGTRHALSLALVGRHAAIDACAALAAAHAAGASIGEALAGLARARPPTLRGEVLAIAGRRVIADCYNANPASMAAALRALAERAPSGRAWAVLGDMRELGDHAAAAHREAGALARELGIAVIALGDYAAALGEEVATPDDAAAAALARTQPGDWILIKASRGMRLERVIAAMEAAR